MLDDFIADNRDEIVDRCRAKVALRSHTVTMSKDSDYGVPLFLEQLIKALRHEPGANVAIGQSAIHHGYDLLTRGFTMSQVRQYLWRRLSGGD